MSTEVDVFETATRLKVRFLSSRGFLSAEQLWDVPLRSRDDFDLNGIAKTVYATLKAAETENFVDQAPNAELGRFEVAMAVVRRVITVKLAEEEALRVAAARKAERARLTQILARKQDATLEGLSEDDIKARLQALS